MAATGNTAPDTDDWRQRLLTTPQALRALLERTRRIAVLGIKTEQQRGQPAYEVPRYLQQAGYALTPVPVYYPEVDVILGRPVVRALTEVPPPLELVNVFRRSQDLQAHLEELLRARPRAVWLQLGIRDDAFAERLARAGIEVVQDRCIMVDHRELLGGARRNRMLT